MEESVKDRLSRFIKFRGLKKRNFEEMAGLSNGYIGSIRKSIGSDSLVKILNAFPDLNRDWLLYGEGEMLLDSEDGNQSVENDLPETGERLIPFYDAETTGGFSGEVSASDPGAIVGYISPGGWFDANETAAIRHVGDSMTEYPNGCILAVRKVKDRHLLVPGQNYVIETTEYRVTKRVQGLNPQRQTIMLRSTNPERYEDGTLVHAPFEVALSDIINIYKVLGYIVNQFGEMRIIKPD